MVEKVNTINVIVLGKNTQDRTLDVSRFENWGKDMQNKEYIMQKMLQIHKFKVEKKWYNDSYIKNIVITNVKAIKEW